MPRDFEAAHHAFHRLTSVTAFLVQLFPDGQIGSLAIDLGLEETRIGLGRRALLRVVAGGQFLIFAHHFDELLDSARCAQKLDSGCLLEGDTDRDFEGLAVTAADAGGVVGYRVSECGDLFTPILVHLRQVGDSMEFTLGHRTVLVEHRHLVQARNGSRLTAS